MVETKRAGAALYRRRMGVLFAGILLIFLLLAVRLYYLQVMCGENLAAGADAQQNMAVTGLDTRGLIYDRNMVPLVGGKNKYYYFIPASKEDSVSAQLLEAVSAADVTGAGSNVLYKVYRTDFYNSLVNRRLKSEYGAYVLMMESRYDENQTACHLIGYINQDEERGVSGLELIYNDILYCEQDEYYLTVDGGGDILKGIAPVKSADGIFDTANSSSVVTTLDSRIQKQCESILSEKELNGAVLVSNAETGEVLVWASSPAFNPEKLEEYISSDDDCLVDKCIQGCYPPGSVFKIVVAAAALEMGEIDPYETFECSGTVTVNGIELGCTAGPEDWHGEVDMYEAMAGSCNCYFAKLGETIGTEAIVQMAEKMGLGQKVFEDFPYESAGNVPAAEELGDWDVSNLSIGQGYLLATPAQIHRMVSIVACGGELLPMYVADESGSSFQRIISEKTAAQLEQMLAEVMESGTGAASASDEYNQTDEEILMYGKTGTAEASVNGNQVNQCWFSGYLKNDGNTWMVTVLIENGVSGSYSALPVFEEIADALVSIY